MKQTLIQVKAQNSRSKPFFKWAPNSNLQAFLDFRGFDFRDFQFTAVYNTILFSTPLVLLSHLDLRGFCFCVFFVSPN